MDRQVYWKVPIIVDLVYTSINPYLGMRRNKSRL